jgi:hypothetical protein
MQDTTFTTLARTTDCNAFATVHHTRNRLFLLKASPIASKNGRNRFGPIVYQIYHNYASGKV